MTQLIQRLAEMIVQDNALLLIGARLQGDPQPPQALDRIAEALAERIDYQRPDRSLPAVARDFEVLEGRRALIQAIKEETERLAGQPESLVRQVAQAVLPHSKVITSRFDQVLERSLESSNKPYVRIVRDTDLPSFDESKVTLIKMQGDIDQPDSLVITEDDIDQFLQRLPAVSDVIRAYFATKTLVFLGFDLESDLFKRFYRQISGQLSAFSRPSYAIVGELPDQVSVRYWEKQNLTLHQQDLAAFVEGLTRAIGALTEAPGPAPANPLGPLAEPPRPGRPYVGLEAFGPGDAAIFAGREIECERLANQVLAHRAGVLYGESGAGKTSLLQAGVLPRLARRRALLVQAAPEAGTALEATLQAALTDTATAAGIPIPEADDLAAAIRALAAELDGPVALALDPFEEIPLAFTPEAQAAAAETLNSLAEDRTLDVRLLLVVREDYLGQVRPLEDRLPGLITARFRLERLGREAARVAMVEPAGRFNAYWDPTLLEAVLDELQPDPTAGVAPPQLAIVCERLYREAARASETTGTHIELALLERLGGVQAILSDHLEAAVAELPDTEQETARRLLGALVSTTAGRLRLGLAELGRAADVSPEAAAGVLEHLTERGLVARYQLPGDDQGGEAAYQLAHEALSPRILTWLGAEFWEAQRAREAVRQALPAWRARNRLMPPDDLKQVVDRIGALQFSEEERELIFANAVAYGLQTEPWSEQVAAGRRQELLLGLLEHREAATRGRGTRALGPISGERVSEALATAALEDPDASVREAAALAIASPKSPDGPAFDAGAVTRLGAAATDGSERSTQAFEALVSARDREPEIQAALPAGIAARIRRSVWAARWARHRPGVLVALLRGLQSGFWGLGLGMGVFLGLYNAGASLGAGTPARFYLGAVLLGLSLAGVLGALAVGAGTFLQALLRALQDRPNPVRTWALTSLVGGAFFSLGLVLIGAVSAGTPRPGETLLAGLIMGIGVAALAGLPWLPARLPRLALTALGGIGTFLAVGFLGLFFDRSAGWLALMGLGCGIGYFFGLEPGSETGEDPAGRESS